MTISADRLEALAEKYRELARLRRSHASGEPHPTKATFVALSARFPGALRELDRLPLAELESRAAALAEAASGSRHVEPWMRVLDAYHGHLRESLDARKGAPTAPRARPSVSAIIERVATTHGWDTARVRALVGAPGLAGHDPQGPPLGTSAG